MTQNHTGKPGAYLALLRPTHWVKNSFVLAPLLFSREFRDFAGIVNQTIAKLAPNVTMTVCGIPMKLK